MRLGRIEKSRRASDSNGECRASVEEDFSTPLRGGSALGETRRGIRNPALPCAALGTYYHGHELARRQGAERERPERARKEAE